MINTINKPFHNAANLDVSYQPACEVTARSSSIPKGKSNPDNPKSQITLGFGVSFWALKFYKALQESTLLPTVNEVVWPLLIVLLMGSG